MYSLVSLDWPAATEPRRWRYQQAHSIQARRNRTAASQQRPTRRLRQSGGIGSIGSTQSTKRDAQAHAQAPATAVVEEVDAQAQERTSAEVVGAVGAVEVELWCGGGVHALKHVCGAFMVDLMDLRAQLGPRYVDYQWHPLGWLVNDTSHATDGVNTTQALCAGGWFECQLHSLIACGAALAHGNQYGPGFGECLYRHVDSCVTRLLRTVKPR